MLVAVVKPNTSTGVRIELVVVPPPSWPLLLDPQIEKTLQGDFREILGDFIGTQHAAARTQQQRARARERERGLILVLARSLFARCSLAVRSLLARCSLAARSLGSLGWRC